MVGVEVACVATDFGLTCHWFCFGLAVVGIVLGRRCRSQSLRQQKWWLLRVTSVARVSVPASLVDLVACA